MRTFLAGAAIAVLLVGAAQAKPGGGGGGGGHGGGQGHGGGGGQGHGGGGHSGGPPPAIQHAGGGNGHGMGNGFRGGHGGGAHVQIQRNAGPAAVRLHGGHVPSPARRDARVFRQPHQVQREAGAPARWHGQAARTGGPEQVRYDERGTALRRFAQERGGDGAPRENLGRQPHWIDGCPPGLAQKNNGCMPPGQVRNEWRPDWFGVRNIDDGDYRYADGYLLRYGGDRVLGYVPLLGGALGIGSLWPSTFAPEPMPVYYRNYYGLGPSSDYRYYDDVIYGIDPDSNQIDRVAALLTGDEFTIGQPMPDGYDVYNVPYDYRDRYRDTPEAMYRYSDGYVYQVDPKTRLIEAAIELLT